MYKSCFAHQLPSGKSLDCGSGSNSSEEQGYAKGHIALSGADTVTATYNVGKQLAMKQPTQTIVHLQVTLKPILVKHAAQQCGCEKSARVQGCNLHV